MEFDGNLLFASRFWTLLALFNSGTSLRAMRTSSNSSRGVINGKAGLHYEGVGCYKDEFARTTVRPVPERILNMRDNFDWNNTWFKTFVELCAKAALSRNFWYFAVQHWAECYSGREAWRTYDRDGLYAGEDPKSRGCWNGIGMDHTNYVYRFVGVNGNWSSWGSWSACSVTCGGGFKTRMRNCTNPKPQFGGRDCQGSDNLNASCDTFHCAVNGNWSSWGSWSACSVTCGGGSKTRMRNCTNPKPRFGGRDCQGNNISNASCDTFRCADSGDFERLTSMSSVTIVSHVVGWSMLACLVTVAMLWCLWKYRRKRSQTEMSDFWEVKYEQILLSEALGEGAFGKVYKGSLVAMPPQPVGKKISSRRPRSIRRKKPEAEETTVAIKMLHNAGNEEQEQEFLAEIRLMKVLGRHPNIVNLLGCCTTGNPKFLVVEYAPYGDLLNYLRRRRQHIRNLVEGNDRHLSFYNSLGARKQTSEDDLVPQGRTEREGSCVVIGYRGCYSKDEPSVRFTRNAESTRDTLTATNLLAFAWQTSLGMEYLSKKSFVHRDLAARNVLIGEHGIAKVADFGLSRYMYEEKVYHSKRQRKLPLKWMSPEAIYDQVFTTKSDVWSFGILLWEIATIGGTPYPTINNRELLRILKNGYRMEKPDICSDDMYKMMRECWRENPELRPSFSQLRLKLEETMLRENAYLDLQNYDETKLYYHVPSFDSANSDASEENWGAGVEQSGEKAAGRVSEMKKIRKQNGESSRKISGLKNAGFAQNFDGESVSTCL